MELFAEAIVAGGVALVAGLWFFEAVPGGTPGRYVGVAFALVGLMAMGAGIWMELAPGDD